MISGSDIHFQLILIVISCKKTAWILLMKCSDVDLDCLPMSNIAGMG